MVDGKTKRDLCDFIESNYKSKNDVEKERQERLLFYGYHFVMCLAGPSQTFSEKLFSLIKEKSISEVDCYKNAGIDRRLFSRMRKRDYQPSKKTVFALIISLKLNESEAKRLLEVAGYTFTTWIKTDLIVLYCITKGIYDLDDVNELLYDQGENTLGSK